MSEIVTKTRYSRGKNFVKKPFWENTRVNEANQCSEWIGGRNPQGYWAYGGVRDSTIHSIINRKTWAHLG